MELREKIARAIFFRGGDQDDTHWKHVQSWRRDIAYEQADAVIAIPEIAEALARADECPRLRVDDDDI